MNTNKNAIFNLQQQQWSVHIIFLFKVFLHWFVKTLSPVIKKYKHVLPKQTMDTQGKQRKRSHSAHSRSEVSALDLNDHSSRMWSSISFYRQVGAEPHIWDLRTLLNLAPNAAAADPLSNNKLNSEEPQSSFILQAGPNFPNSACSFSLALVLSFHQAIISCATGLTAPASLLGALLSCPKKRTQRKRF